MGLRENSRWVGRIEGPYQGPSTGGIQKLNFPCS